MQKNEHIFVAALCTLLVAVGVGIGLRSLKLFSISPASPAIKNTAVATPAVNNPRAPLDVASETQTTRGTIVSLTPNALTILPENDIDSTQIRFTVSAETTYTSIDTSSPPLPGKEGEETPSSFEALRIGDVVVVRAVSVVDNQQQAVHITQLF